ncbi:glycosyltransferase family A protein [Dactylosporangium sp. NPDC051484]|uniref:glycosyltransferase n=1 Tax=Dactylosporangium sp. NPDC051484 TaxID=3154942 RepID=UPI00344C7AFF
MAEQRTLAYPGSRPRYVLVTAARDEGERLVRTIAGVRAQTWPPLHWVIVDDGSADDTAGVVRRHIEGADWITLVRRTASRPADFASKVFAVRDGLARLEGLEYDFVGTLDADIAVDADYFERLLGVFAGAPRLGIAGGQLVEEYDGRGVRQRISADSVSGATQMFRREVFEAIGGLRPVRLGGEDSVAEIMARMRGWEVSTRFELPVRHQGRVLSRNKGALRAWFVRGQANRGLRYDPVFQLAVSAYRAVVQPPYLLSGALMLAGYVAAAARGTEPALDRDAVAYLRGEQRRRLWGMIGYQGGGLTDVRNRWRTQVAWRTGGPGTAAVDGGQHRPSGPRR